MVKLQEELIISIDKKNKSGSINRFESLFLQFKKIKKACQEKNDVLQKKISPVNIDERAKVVTPVKTGVQMWSPRNSRSILITRFQFSPGTLDSGACPGPDPGFPGMTDSVALRIYPSSLRWMVNGES